MSIMKVDYGDVGGASAGATGIIQSPSAADFTIIELGFAPTDAFIYTNYGTQNAIVLHMVVSTGKIYRTWANGFEEDYTSSFDTCFIVDGTTLKYKAYTASYYTNPTRWVAIKEQS